jgi:glucans biosynthesis protein
MISADTLFRPLSLQAGAAWVRIFAILLLLVLSPFLCGNTVYAKKTNSRPFTIEEVIRKARDLAGKPYQEPPKVSDQLLKMGYDAWRDIRFRPEKSIWRGKALPFELQFFHPGFYYDRTVSIHLVEKGKVKTLSGTKEMFDYGKNQFTPSMPEKIGLAGFRVHGPIKTTTYYDEIITFLGASYLRALGRNHNYGLSARGLAVDTASPKGEEFPWFREFWIVQPSPHSKYLQIYALLDSQRVTGAFAYRVIPGITTVVKVESTLFFREPVAKLGIGPLTSMFFLGENTSPRKFDDFRPEVHDSDGLQILLANGEWLWRPLQNPSSLQVSGFNAPDVRGFGLIQRDRKFRSYQDLETRYEKRPSVWVVPRGKWGPGRVELVQIPTLDNIHDNIVAYWVPSAQPTPGKPLKISYEMRWMDADRILPPLGYVTSSRSGNEPAKGTRIFVLEFNGKPLRRLPPNAPVKPDVWVGEGGKLIDQQALRNPVTHTWRLAFRVQLDETSTLEQMLPHKRPPVEIRAALKLGDKVLSETWSYAYKP